LLGIWLFGSCLYACFGHLTDLQINLSNVGFLKNWNPENLPPHRSGTPETSLTAHGNPARLTNPRLQIDRLSANFRPGLPAPMSAQTAPFWATPEQVVEGQNFRFSECQHLGVRK